jgi:hypothetical protein
MQNGIKIPDRIWPIYKPKSLSSSVVWVNSLSSSLSVLKSLYSPQNMDYLTVFGKDFPLIDVLGKSDWQRTRLYFVFSAMREHLHQRRQHVMNCLHLTLYQIVYKAKASLRVATLLRAHNQRSRPMKA